MSQLKNRLEYKLKHSTAFQKIFNAILGLLIRFLGLFVIVDHNLILFNSFMGKSFNDSPKVIYEYIMKHDTENNFKYVWAFEHPEKYDFLECDKVKIDTLKYFIIALKAKYWVTCVNIERGLKFKKKKTIYINTWHGIALKKIGNDCKGRKDYDFSDIDYLCVSGEYDKKVCNTAFNTSEKNYLCCGMPRNDELYAINEDRILNLKKELNIPLNKKIILYAPTWRDSINNGITYDIKPPINFGKWKDELGDDYIILFRAHVITTKIMGIEFNDFVRDFSNHPYVNDLLIVTDLLITDYSSIAMDYSITERPILCFGYDYDDYLITRGCYVDANDVFPNGVQYTEEEIINKIKNINYYNEKEKTIIFKERFREYGGNATKECSDIILKSISKHGQD